jgi:diguanylate cyclase (GGDEF)-like protein/PAS domain S-box-containing protein
MKPADTNPPAHIHSPGEQADGVESSLRSILDHAPVLLWTSDSTGARDFFNQSWLRFTGRNLELELGDGWTDGIHPDDRDATVETIFQAAGEGLPYEIEYRLRREDGQHRWVRETAVPRRLPGASGVGFVGACFDITEQRESTHQRLADALHDSLTGLPNRAMLLDRAEHALARLQRNPDYKFAAMVLDLDRFKIVNDSIGHHLGDKLLVESARRISRCVRPMDTVARLGGDEFVLLLEDLADPHDAVRIAERVQEVLRAPFNIDGHDVFTAASIGIAVAGPQYRMAADLLRDADTALNRAKAAGKGTHQMFDARMHEQAVGLMKLESELRRAIERGELEAWFQPIVHLRTCQPVSMEALVRWNHPQRGLVSPSEFIPLAEDTGLISAIGFEVLRQSLLRAARWRKSLGGAAPGVSVNLSPRQLGQPDLLDRVGLLLRESGLPPEMLTLEITESLLMQSPEQAIQLLGRLKGMGIQISLDDFGTGYSSLGYLNKFPIDTIKIDRSFVRQMHVEEDDATIVRTIVGLGKQLRLKLTAEGVENREQSEALARIGCDNGQGFLFSKPLPPEQADAWLAEHTQRLQTHRLSA